MPDTTVLPAPKVLPADPASATDRGWKVVLYNDEVHDFITVVFALQRAAGLSVEVAEMVAYEAHSAGSAVVKSGLDRDDAMIICAGLRKWTRIDGHTGGVECEAIRDDE
ncbi:MAG: ATP-dependent Clp protease adaptor ClpS [Planctomycetota bacterium]|jgi:ATP-dependent Clp protease adapter protein ClpS|nr:ATP-dependent Clp protease adaptor ClpS [Planctomycetota bacterium]